MDTDPSRLVTSAPAIQGNQPHPAAQINEPHSSTTPDRKRLPYYNSKAAATTGIIQILCGVVAFILEIIYLTTKVSVFGMDKVAVGIWGGALFSLTGVIGICSVKKKRGMVMAYFVLSIISIIVALVGLSFAVAHYITSTFFYYNEVTVAVVSMVVNIIEGLTAFVASSFGCAARLCCGAETVIHERVIYMPSQGPAPADTGFQPTME